MGTLSYNEQVMLVIQKNWGGYAMKRASYALLALVFILSVVLSACTSNKNANAPSPNPSPSSSPSAQPESGSPAPASPDKTDANGKYDPPIEFTTVRVAYPYPQFEAGSEIAEDWNNNVWIKEYLDTWGIKVVNEWTAEDAQYPTRVNLMITTGDLPDYFKVNEAQLRQLIEADMIADLTDVYDKYASDVVKTVFDEAGEKAINTARRDGKLYAVPWTKNHKENLDTLWVRTDWLKKLNLQEPKTMQDVIAIAQAFTKNDPDGNGQNDTFGIPADNTFREQRGFLAGFHAYWDIWIKDASGDLAFSSIQPEMKTALAQMQSLYKEGVINKELPVVVRDKVTEDFANGKFGLGFSASSHPMQLNIDNDPNAEWKPMKIPSIDNNPTKVQAETAIDEFWVVRKGYEHPEAIFKILHSWLHTFYFNSDQEVSERLASHPDRTWLWFLSQILIYRPFYALDITKKVNANLKGADNESEMTPLGRTVLGNVKAYLDGDKKQFGMGSSFGPGGGYSVMIDLLEDGEVIENEFSSSSTPTMAEKWSSLQTMKNEAFMGIVTGLKSIDEFDAFVANWKSAGGDDITREVNEWYKASQ